MANLTLYYRNGCPYCLFVVEYMKKNHISIPLKNIGEHPSIREELIKIGGKSQVPCLVIDGKTLYESTDIIEWLKANFKK